MKSGTILLAVILFLVFANAHPTLTMDVKAKNAGIAFHQGSWDEALQLAKMEGKSVFVTFTARWCSNCKLLKSNTFSKAEVGRLYNANFINLIIDGENGEGIELVRKYKIRVYPSLIFIDSDGRLIADIAGYQSPKQLIDKGTQIINR